VYSTIRDRAPSTPGLDGLIANAERSRIAQSQPAVTLPPVQPLTPPVQPVTPPPPPPQNQPPISVPTGQGAVVPGGDVKPNPPGGTPVNVEAVARGVIDRFAAAYGRKDIGELRRIYPGIDSRTYERTFADNRSLSWTIQGCDARGDAAQIVATCAIVAGRVDNFGRSATQNTRREMTLARAGDGWVITAMMLR
jgi:hypothetical protein